MRKSMAHAHLTVDASGNALNHQASFVTNPGITDEYDVCNFYHQTGCPQQVARSDKFNNFTLAVISLNAVYIGVDADHNHAEELWKSDLIFIMCENVFCTFFSLELLVRFLAFNGKANALRDNWFKFDSTLVTLMIAETWIVPGVTKLFEGGS